MMSMIYLKRHGGTVKVHNKDAVGNIVDDCAREKELLELKKRQRYGKKQNSTELSSLSSSSTSTVSAKYNVSKPERLQDWLNEKAIKHLQDKASSECHAAKRLYSPLLETERTFVKELDDYLLNKELTDLRRKENLHKRWSDQVYVPIRMKLTDAVNRYDWLSLDYHKRELYRQFLEHVNKRGFVFLNDDDTEQYYAQALNDHRLAPLKVQTGDLRDPLLVESRHRLEEDGTLLQCMTGNRYSHKDLAQMRLPPLSPTTQNRHRTGCSDWSKISYNNIDNISKERNRNRSWGNNTRTNIDLGAWAQEDYDPKVATQELRISHKRMFTEHPPYGKPPATIEHVPFIDPEDFADKIININPFPQHMENLRAEDKAARECFLQHQQYLEQQTQPEQPSEENKIPSQSMEVSCDSCQAVATTDE